MTIQNDFLPFAVGGGANVLDQSVYAADTTLLANGVQTGAASSAQANKTWRQPTIIASVIAQYINAKTGQNTIDDGTTSTLLTNFADAIINNAVTIDTGTTPNTYSGTLSPTPTLSDGFKILFKPSTSNTTISTFNLNGLGAAAIVTPTGPLVGGEMTAGNFYQLAWLSSVSSWLLLGAQATALTQATSDNSTKIATTAYVKNQAYATIASPNLTGIPTAPTPGSGDNSATLATTAFVKTAVTNGTTDLIPSGTRMVFAQGSAPTGWTQDTSDTANNRMMRVVASSGGGVGGNLDPTYITAVPAHTHSFVTGTENQAHSHGVYDPGHAHSYLTRTAELVQSGGSTTCWHGDQYVSTGASTTGISLYNENANHNHNGTTDNGSSQTAITMRYVNLIICSKN